MKQGEFYKKLNDVLESTQNIKVFSLLMLALTFLF